MCGNFLAPAAWPGKCIGGRHKANEAKSASTCARAPRYPRAKDVSTAKRPEGPSMAWRGAQAFKLK